MKSKEKQRGKVNKNEYPKKDFWKIEKKNFWFVSKKTKNLFQLDPESENQMEQFRTAQTVCRQNKEKLDQLKEDTLHKTQILAKSRTTLLLEMSTAYLKELEDYNDEMSKSYAQALEDLHDIDSYEIDVLKVSDSIDLQLLSFDLITFFLLFRF